MARVPLTVLLLFPSRKLTWHGASFMACKTAFGSDLQSSWNWFSPITDMLAHRSTMPWVPYEAKRANSSDMSSAADWIFRSLSMPGGLCWHWMVVLLLTMAWNRWDNLDFTWDGKDGHGSWITSFLPGLLPHLCISDCMDGYCRWWFTM